MFFFPGSALALAVLIAFVRKSLLMMSNDAFYIICGDFWLPPRIRKNMEKGYNSGRLGM